MQRSAQGRSTLEGDYIGLSQVVYDEGEGIFKMWYRSSDGFTARREETG